MSDSHRFVDGLEGMGSDYVRPRTKAAMSDSTRGTGTVAALEHLRSRISAGPILEGRMPLWTWLGALRAGYAKTARAGALAERKYILQLIDEALTEARHG